MWEIIIFNTYTLSVCFCLSLSHTHTWIAVTDKGWYEENFIVTFV
jgi:hypothetical protein